MRRALLHLQDADQRPLRFILEVNPYGGVAEVDAETGETLVGLTKYVDQPRVDEWSPIVGDAAHNLMSALDHLICQLSIQGHVRDLDVA